MNLIYTHRLLITLLVALSAGMLAPQILYAQGSGAAEGSSGEARSMFEKGIEMAQQERWAEALEFFERSRVQANRPVTVFNIASTLYRLGRAGEALQAIDEFLQISDETRDAVEREEAQRLRKEVQESLVTLTLKVDPPTAVVNIDGAEQEGVGPNRELTLDPGTHVITSTARGHTSYRSQVSMLPGETSQKTITLKPERAIVVIDSGTDDASVRIDGESVGFGRVEIDLEPGMHEIDVPENGFERSVDLQPGQRLELDASVASSSIVESPIFWALVGVAVAGAVVGVGFATDAFVSEEAPYPGTAGFVLEALTGP